MDGMDTPKNLTSWLHKLGYEGKIPPNLKPICNPTTALLWEQLIHTVKPRQEIQHIRNNILINRLSKNDETCSSPSIAHFKHELKYPIKEIEILNRKQQLEKQISALHDHINEAETKLEKLDINNKTKYMNLENIKQKIRENDQQTFLLRMKSKKIAAETIEVDEMLTLARNLTPVEYKEQTGAEVLETLTKCSAKLTQIITNNETAPSLAEKTPHHKRVLKEPNGMFTSTKISNQNRRKFKTSDDSLGLLEDFSMTFDDALAASSFKDLNVSNVNMCYDLAILNDQSLNGLVENTLRKYDRFFIWNLLIGLNELCKMHLISAIVSDGKEDPLYKNEAKKDGTLIKLYATHVNYELKTMQIDMKIRELQRKLQAKNIYELDDQIRLQQKEAGLIAMLQHLDRTVQSMRESTTKQDYLGSITEMARNLEENIGLKLAGIDHKLRSFKQIYDLVMQARDETCMLARKLGQFTANCDWTMLLSSNVCSDEIQTFLEFPLEYNRKTGSKAFVRDLPINQFPYQEQFDSNSVLMLVTILQNPCSPAETILLHIVRTKLKMEQLKALKCTPGHFESKGYTLEQLQSQESYVAYALDKLKYMIHAASGSKALHILEEMQEAMKLWMEMPIRHCVSPGRLFNNLPYKHYEKLFEKFYEQL